MAVEIVIHSGERQGESLRFDAREIRVGDRPEFEVYFNPGTDEPARNQSAIFRLEPDGWKIHNTGVREVLVNEDLVTSSARIRSGDMIRMSPDGPDFSFSLLSGLSQAAGLTPGTAAKLPDSSAVAAQEEQPPKLPASEPASSEQQSMPPPGHPTVLTGAAQRAVGLAVAGLAVIVLLGWLVWGGPGTDRLVGNAAVPPTTEPEIDSDNGTSDKQPDGASAQTGAESHSGADQSAAGQYAARPATHEAPQAKPDPWASAVKRIEPALVLFQVEDPKSSSVWPFATGCAIDPQTILTSATVGSELEKFRADGWQAWAIRLSDESKYMLKEIRVHVGHTASESEPEKRVYFDVARVIVQGTLPATAQLAGTESLAELDRGYPIAWCGIPHDGEAINRFQSFSAESAAGKVFVITSLPPSPGGPRLLHLNVPIPENVIGSPLINPDGKIVAVYCSPAASEAQGARPLNLHYALVVEPQLLGLSEGSESEKVWVAPKGKMTNDE